MTTYVKFFTYKGNEALGSDSYYVVDGRLSITNIIKIANCEMNQRNLHLRKNYSGYEIRKSANRSRISTDYKTIHSSF